MIVKRNEERGQMEDFAFSERAAEEIKAVYDRLSDEQSRRIFEERLLFYLTGDRAYMLNVLRITDEYGAGRWRTVNELLESGDLRDSKFILYGAGAHSEEYLRLLQENDYSVFAFCDRDKKKQASGHLGLRVIAPKDLRAHTDKAVVVATAGFRDEMYAIVRDAGFDESRVFVLGKFEEAYFGPDFMTPAGEEVFVDAGAFDGYTMERFAFFCGESFKKIYAFEPNAEWFGFAEKRLAQYAWRDRVALLNKAVWSHETTLRFTEAEQGSHINAAGAAGVRTAAIDDIVEGDAVTWIKMDVEGAELEALRGAEKTIRRDRPRLTICVYHKPQDILTIPLYIQSLVPTYRFCLRHHDFDHRFCETVLYALPEDSRPDLATEDGRSAIGAIAD
jgi:FkbM family methyltransferase